MNFDLQVGILRFFSLFRKYLVTGIANTDKSSLTVHDCR